MVGRRDSRRSAYFSSRNFEANHLSVRCKTAGNIGEILAAKLIDSWVIIQLSEKISVF